MLVRRSYRSAIEQQREAVDASDLADDDVAIARDVDGAFEFFSSVEPMKEGSKPSFARADGRILQLGEVDTVVVIACVPEGESSNFVVDVFVVGAAEELVNLAGR